MAKDMNPPDQKQDDGDNNNNNNNNNKGVKYTEDAEKINVKSSPTPPKQRRHHSESPNKYEGRINSVRKLIRLNGSGDLFAIPHPVKKTGYKSPKAYGFRPVFRDDTTNSFYQNSVVKIGEEQASKKLIPYHPNAPCNRCPQSTQNNLGTRFSDCRNASFVSRLYSGNPKYMKTPKTTNELYMNYKCDKVGNSNPAVFSDKVIRMHRHQQDL